MSLVGVVSAPTRPQLVSMSALSKQIVRGSEAARFLPPVCYGVSTIDLLAAVFMCTLEKPYPLFSCTTVPLNVRGKRTLPSLVQHHRQLWQWKWAVHRSLQRCSRWQRARIRA